MASHRAALLAAAILAASSAALATPALDPGEDAGEGAGERWIVGFEALARADLEDGTWQGHRVLDVNEAIAFALVEVRDPASFHLEDRHRENVAYVERDDPTAYGPLHTPDDPRFGEQYAFPQIGAPSAWNLTTGEASVNVSVVDSGIDQDHEDLQDTLAGQHDFVSDDGEAEDRCGHGTHVAGTVSANTDNGIGVAGTADGVRLLVAKVLSNTLVVQCTGSASDVADGITWSTDQGADVISMSLGSDSASSTIGEAVDYAWENGVLLVAAAGNDGSCSDCVAYPAARERVVAVTCTDPAREQCSFSSQGPEAELAAPGDDVLSTEDGGGYGEKSGTSMSAPHVSGAAGLALSLDPTITHAQLRDLLNATARDLGEEGHDAVYGHGELDAAALLETLGEVNLAPTASFEATCEELNCTFDASNASDDDGHIVEYNWTLGDNASATGTIVNHTYEAEGTYDVQLTVKDDEGALDSVSTQVTVSTTDAGGLLEEDFDDGAAQGFQLEGLWHVSDACAEAASAPNYLAYNRDESCTYDTGDETTGAATFTVDLEGASTPELVFQHRWETESTSCGILSCNGYDHMRVQVREDGEWTTLEEWTSLEENQLAWTQARYDLPANASSVDVRFLFDSRDGYDNDFEGWLVDDVRIADAG